MDGVPRVCWVGGGRRKGRSFRGRKVVGLGQTAGGGGKAEPSADHQSERRPELDLHLHQRKDLCIQLCSTQIMLRKRMISWGEKGDLTFYMEVEKKPVQSTLKNLHNLGVAWWPKLFVLLASKWE